MFQADVQEWAKTKVSQLYNLDGEGIELMLLEEKINYLMGEMAYMAILTALAFREIKNG